MPDNKKITRLSDMRIDEVSVVDRPANQRKWILVKREGEDMTTLVEGTDGSLIPLARTAESQGSGSPADLVTKLRALAGHARSSSEVGAETVSLLAECVSLSDALVKGMESEVGVVKQEHAVSAAEAAIYARGGKTLGGLADALVSTVEALTTQSAPIRQAEAQAVRKILGRLAEAVGTEAKPSAGRFTPARIEKLTGALRSLGEVLQEVGASQLADLPALLKAEQKDTGSVVELLKGLAVSLPSEALEAEIRTLQKRLEELEKVGISRSLGDGGKPKDSAAPAWGGYLWP